MKIKMQICHIALVLSGFTTPFPSTIKKASSWCQRYYRHFNYNTERKFTMITEQLELHPLCSLFPPCSEEEFEALKTSIAEHGLFDPIVLFDGKILDGANRYRAVCELRESGKDIELKTIEFTGNDPVKFVTSKNLHRRHLSTSQRAMIASELENMGHGGDRKSKVANLRLDISRSDVAKQLNVSMRSVASAKKVREASSEGILQQIKIGELSLNKAQDTLKQAEQETGIRITKETPESDMQVVQAVQERIILEDALTPKPVYDEQMIDEYIPCLSGWFDTERWQYCIDRAQETIVASKKLPELFDAAFDMCLIVEKELEMGCPQLCDKDLFVARNAEHSFRMLLEMSVYEMRRLKERFRNDKTNYKEVKEIVEDLHKYIPQLPNGLLESESEALEQYKQECIEGCQKLIKRGEAILKKLSPESKKLRKMSLFNQSSKPPLSEKQFEDDQT